MSWDELLNYDFSYILKDNKLKSSGPLKLKKVTINKLTSTRAITPMKKLNKKALNKAKKTLAIKLNMKTLRQETRTTKTIARKPISDSKRKFL